MARRNGLNPVMNSEMSRDLKRVSRALMDRRRKVALTPGNNEATDEAYQTQHSIRDSQMPTRGWIEQKLLEEENTSVLEGSSSSWDDDHDTVLVKEPLQSWKNDMDLSGSANDKDVKFFSPMYDDVPAFSDILSANGMAKSSRIAEATKSYSDSSPTSSTKDEGNGVYEQLTPKIQEGRVMIDTGDHDYIANPAKAPAKAPIPAYVPGIIQGIPQPAPVAQPDQHVDLPLPTQFPDPVDEQITEIKGELTVKKCLTFTPDAENTSYRLVNSQEPTETKNKIQHTSFDKSKVAIPCDQMGHNDPPADDGDKDGDEDKDDDKTEGYDKHDSKEYGVPISWIYTIDNSELLRLVRKPDMFTNPTDWPSWSESFVAYCDVAKINDRDKVKVLLTYLHPKILRDKVNLVKFSEVELNDLHLAIKKLGKHISEPSSTMSSRLRLVKTCQRGKTLSQFVDAIKTLSRDCQFGDEKVRNTTMISTLIGGLADNSIRFELLKKRDGYKTFDEAVEDAVRFDLAKSTLAEVGNQNNDLLFEIRNSITKTRDDTSKIVSDQFKIIEELRTELESMKNERHQLRYSNNTYKRRDQRSDSPKREIVCHYCNKPYHLMKDCWNMKRDLERAEERKFPNQSPGNPRDAEPRANDEPTSSKQTVREILDSYNTFKY